jgi:hypothetical protein
MILNICTSKHVYNQIWLNPPTNDPPLLLQILMDDQHFDNMWIKWQNLRVVFLKHERVVVVAF